MKPVLHLNLKKKWFDMILSGEKKEEYREMSAYWKRFFSGMFYINSTERLATVTIKDIKYLPKNITICFSNGYAKNRRQFFIELESIHIRKGRPEWGAEPGKYYFVLSLGKKI